MAQTFFLEGGAAILFAIIVFLIGREVVCWYLKLNEITDLLERIEENTRKGGSLNKKDSEKESTS